MTARIGIVCGLASEARIARQAIPSGTTVAIRVSGASSKQAYSDAKSLIATGLDVLVSLGVAGGLDVECKPGTLVIGDTVKGPDGSSVNVSKAIVGSLLDAAHSAGLETRVGGIIGVDCVVSDADQKRRLAKQSGALAIDMESHPVAKAASQAGVAFAIIRTIADPSDRSIPKLALSIIGPNGRVRPFYAAIAIVSRPQEFPQLLRLGRDTNTALKSLRRAAEAFFPAFG